MPSGNLPDGMAVNVEKQAAFAITVTLSISFGRLPNETGESPVPPIAGENVNYTVKSGWGFLESVPEVSAKLKAARTADRNFEDVVKDAEEAAVLVLVLNGGVNGGVFYHGFRGFHGWGKEFLPTFFYPCHPRNPWLKELLATVCRRTATERKFEDVVKSAEQAAVLVLVY